MPDKRSTIGTTRQILVQKDVSQISAGTRIDIYLVTSESTPQIQPML